VKVIVIGAGLIGVTTAYCLNASGHEVTVIDRASAAGREASYANGGLLTASMADPWNAPGCWRVLLASLGRSDAALQLRLRALPSLLGWGTTFLRNATAAAFETNALKNLRLALYSLRMMTVLRERSGIQYSGAARGSLRVFRDETKLEEACAVAQRREGEGLSFRRLSPQGTVELEPALVPIAPELAGSLHYHADETGDAYQFCGALAEYIRRRGVEFRFRTEVTAVAMRSGQVSAVQSAAESFVADRYVMATGSYSEPLLQRIGVHVPVRPVKGYSISVDDPTGPTLGVPVVDDELHAAIVPLGKVLRVAGTAEFAGYDLTLHADRVANLVGLLRDVLPQMKFEPAAVKAWCGLRPMSVDGVPIIGRTHVSNLFVNTGHGHLGWTAAAGSAQLLADLMCGNDPAIDPAPLALERFTSA
jgi:D-amino-acid dehydrogenase